MSENYILRNARLPARTWALVKQACANHQMRTGEIITQFQWIEDAVMEKLEREPKTVEESVDDGA